MRTKTLVMAALLATCTVEHAAAAAGSEAYPTKPLRFVVGLAPGGATDIVARLVGQKLTEAIGQPVIVDNRSGAAGSIAGAIVTKALPDGYTLHAVSSSFAINPSLYDLPFDSLKDFVPVVQIAQAPFLLVTTPSLRVESVKELIAVAKAKPGTLLFSSGGNGGSGHLAGELFKRMADLRVDHVPFRGGSPAVAAVMSGEVHFTFSAIVAGLQQTRAGRLRALGVTSGKRSRAAPDVPTIAEAGVPGYQVLTWYGLLAPAGTPREIVTKLNTAVAKIVRMPDVAEKLLADGAEPVGGTPAEFARHLADEINRFKKLTKDIGLKTEKL
ncbi:MAG TPA: tripartite tricarboxylate transporter substrate binding protein [Burkholderiales bacterium]|nr:tripartite tricarboxylate transporter substrate binding protein [Burkholderiales bacterium]